MKNTAIIKNDKFRATMDQYAVHVEMMNDGKWENYDYDRLIEVGAPEPTNEEKIKMIEAKYPEILTGAN